MNLFSKRNIGILLFIGAFIIYLFTAAQSLMFTDNGELAAVCVSLGVAHPTGYPLFTLLGHLWSLLPIPFSMIAKLNLFAAFVTALSVSVFFYIMILVFEIITKNEKSSAEKKKNVKGKLTIQTQEMFTVTLASASALIYAFALTIWQQATFLEIYSLQLLMFNLIIWTAIKAWQTDNETMKYYLLLAFLTGLGFSNHMTTVLLVPALLFLFFYRQNSGFDFTKDRIRFALILIIPFVLGLSLYLYLPLRSATMPEFNWGWVSRSFDKFWYHVSGKQYRVWMFSDPATPGINAEKFFNVFLQQFGWIGVIPLLVGFISFYKKSKALFWFVLLFVFTCIIYSFNYGIHDIETYFSLTFIGLIIFVGIGLYSLFHKYSKFVAIAFIIPLISLLGNYSENDKSMNFLVPEYTRIMTDNLESNAIIISSQWDYYCSAFWYLQRIENYRSDVVLVEKELLRRTWYLEQFRRWYPDVAKKSENEMKLYDSQLELFEAEKAYDQFLIQKYYIDFINSVIDKNIGKRPVYITPEILQSQTDKDIGAKYQKVPAGFAFKLVDGNELYTPDLSKIDVDKLLHGVFDRNDHLVNGLLETVSMALTNIGRYAQYSGNPEIANKAYRKALKVYPQNETAVMGLRQLEK